MYDQMLCFQNLKLVFTLFSFPVFTIIVKSFTRYSMCSKGRLLGKIFLNKCYG